MAPARRVARRLPRGLARRLAGLAAAAAIAYGVWLGWESYGLVADVGRWSGIDALGFLRGWLVEFRTPILCAALFLALTALSWLWQKLKLGH